MLSLHIRQNPKNQPLLMMITSDSYFHAIHKLGFELTVVPHLIIQSDCGKVEENKQKNNIHITLRNTQLNKNI